MYVIFPLDQLLDIDSSDKSSKQKSDSRKSTADPSSRHPITVPSPPSHPTLQNHPNKKLSPNIPEDQSSKSSAVNQGEGQQLISPTSNQQEKPSRTDAFSSSSTLVKPSPSTLPSSPTNQSSHQQQVLSSVSAGGVATSPSSLSNSATAASATTPGAKGLLKRHLSFHTTTSSSSHLTTPQRKNASACASWAGSPPARETPPVITRSASFFLNRDRKVNDSAYSRVSNIDKSDSFRQQVIKKSEILRTNIVKSESFCQKESVSILKRSQSKQGRPPAPPEEARRDARSSSEVDGDRSLKRSEPSTNGKHTSKQDPFTSVGLTSSSVEPDSEIVGSDGSGRSRGSSSSTSKSRRSSNLAGKLAIPPIITKPPLIQQHSPPISAQPQCPPSPIIYITPQYLAMSNEPSFKDLSYPALGEILKSHNSATFKLIKTVSDFSAQLSRLHERHAEDLQLLVESYRKKHSDLRNERPPCASQVFQAWETLLQEVEVDSQLHSDVAGTFVRQVSRPLIEKTFHRKLQSKKLFAHRDSIETILGKTEEMLKKCRREHTEAYHNHCRLQSNASLASYFDSHNSYVQQLHATNAMLHHYNSHTQPAILQELEEVHLDVNGIVMDSILQGADVLAVKAQEQYRRYDALSATCRNSDPRTDVVAFVKHFDNSSYGHKGIPQHRFILPQPPPPAEGEVEELQAPEIPSFNPLRNELVLDRLAALSSRTRAESLKREATDLEKQIAQLQEGMDALIRAQQRNLESSLYHKANELQEDISMKRFDLRVNQVHLAAVRAQKELFASKEGPTTESRDRKMSGSSSGTMKSKWMKAFKSLKTTSGSSGSYTSGGATSRDPDRKNGRDRGMESSSSLFDNSHILQEYTYKKITACDVCHQILRGHSRQGLKCRLCKTNCHVECQEKLPRCQPKSRLLRRQRSTSEIESKQMDPGEDETEPTISITSLIASQPGRRMKDPPSPSTASPNSSQFPLPPKGSGAAPSNPGKTTEEVDLIYQVLKQAGEISGRRSAHGSVERDLGCVGGGSGPSSGSGSVSSLHRRHPQQRPTHAGSTLTVNPPPIASSSAPISPRRQKLCLRMKSFSLDSPESSEQRRRQVSSSQSSQISSSFCQSPSSPVHNRRLLSTRTMRMSSVELPDDNEKSFSSASTSPCPSPVSKKPHRLLPTNLYVVLYNFTSRHPDELDLRAGYKVTVTDTSDPDWWQGKCLGRSGFFPSKYVTRLNAGEKPLQVTHNLQVSDGENGIKLLRDQIVIQIGEEIEGMVMIRNGDNQQGVCPIKYLQEA